jgi:peptide-methionine (R)-S-oxide reductase
VKPNRKELLSRLTPEQYRVTQEAGTERPYSGEYWNLFADGKYACVVCGEILFESSSKFESHCGWPSFSQPADGLQSGMARGLQPEEKILDENSRIEDRWDKSHGMIRVEVVCRNCKAHLGHVFDDGPPPDGLRYCINSASLRFIPS